jgi:molybdopterin molybdotransferase
MRMTTISSIQLKHITQTFSEYDENALSVSMAQAIIEKFIQPIYHTETVALKEGLGRVLAEDILSPLNVPNHDNSAMDGYAFNSADLHSSHDHFQIIGTAYAGKPFTAEVERGQCVRIMTGAWMPQHCDTVIPQEHAELINEQAIANPKNSIQAGENRRCVGEDIAKDSIVLEQGKILSPADLGLLGSIGCAEILVQRRLKIAYFSTGDEIRSMGEQLDAGALFDSNRFTITGMCQRLGCELIDMGVVKDDPMALKETLKQACQMADAIITSGGVSVGAADFTKQVMAELGDVAFWTIGMRPGRPMAFGKIHNQDHSAYLFGLPGNPVAVMVTFYFFVRQALTHLMRAKAPELIRVSAISQNQIRKKKGRTEYQRGILSYNEDAQLQVCITGAQGSGILSSMSQANCMLILDEDRGTVQIGEPVSVVLFNGLI